jgi:uncharacterized protein
VNNDKEPVMLLRRLMFVLAFAAVLGLSGAGQAGAQTSGAHSPARLAAAKDLVSVMRLPDTMRGMFPLIWRQMVSPLISRDDPRIKAAVDSLAPTITAEMEREIPRFGELIAGIYAEHFTEEELRAIAVFMRSPTGQTFLAKQNVLAQASMTAGQQFGQSLLARIRPRIEEELKQKLGPR